MKSTNSSAIGFPLLVLLSTVHAATLNGNSR